MRHFHRLHKSPMLMFPKKDGDVPPTRWYSSFAELICIGQLTIWFTVDTLMFFTVLSMGPELFWELWELQYVSRFFFLGGGGFAFPPVFIAIFSILELEASYFNCICNILEFEPLIFHCICNIFCCSNFSCCKVFSTRVHLGLGVVYGCFRVDSRLV